MTSIVSSIENFFRQKSVLSILIAINVTVFVVIKIIALVFLLFKLPDGVWTNYIELPAEIAQLLQKPWTLISYMFVHYGIWHILFNMLWLYWFGKIFLYFFNARQLGGLYVLGGIAGAFLYIFSYNIFPYFQDAVSFSYLIGASASVMAIVFAAAFYQKDFTINLFLLGRIKIIYIAIFCLILDLISIQEGNAGGHIAHIGGAFLGIAFAESYKKGKDITAWLNSLIDSLVNLFKRKPKKVKVHYKRAETDLEYNTRKAKENLDIDTILDKIKHSGYDSLSEDEKRKLFDASKK